MSPVPPHAAIEASACGPRENTGPVVSGHVAAIEASVHDPPRGDRAIPCNGGSNGAEPPVAKHVGGAASASAAGASMVRPRSDPMSSGSRKAPRGMALVNTRDQRSSNPSQNAPIVGSPTGFGLRSSAARRAHPESYTVHLPGYFYLNPERLSRRWLSMPSGPQDVLLFDVESELPNGMLSNWFVHDKPWAFKLPEWCGSAFVAEAGLPTTIEVVFSELPIMLCKAALMKDTARYNALLRVDSPSSAKAVGRRITPWDEAKWQSRVCAVALAVTRQKTAGDPRISDFLRQHKGRLIAETSGEDRVWAIARTSTDPLARTPNEWLGANVLGWAWMQAGSELGDEAPNPDDGSHAVEVSDLAQVVAKSDMDDSPFYPDPATAAGEDFVQMTRSRGSHSVASEAPLPPGVSVPLECSVLVSAMLSAQLQCTAFCVFITTLLEPLVLAHADGDTHIGLQIQGEAGNARGLNDRLLEQAERACKSVLPQQPTTLVPAGLTHAHGSPVIAAPVAFVPPPHAVARSPRQRRSMLAAGATFVFLTVAALAGTPANPHRCPGLSPRQFVCAPSCGLARSDAGGSGVGGCCSIPLWRARSD